MKHNEPFEDDGRTVADMSGIEHDSIWLPRRRKQGHTNAQQPQQAADRPWEEDPQLTGKERLWAILGAESYPADLWRLPAWPVGPAGAAVYPLALKNTPAFVLAA